MDIHITHVRYNDAGTHIDQVRTLSNGDMPRNKIAALIAAGEMVYTAYKNTADQLIQGAKIILEHIEAETFIKTVPDRIKKDNLSALPRF